MNSLTLCDVRRMHIRAANGSLYGTFKIYANFDSMKSRKLRQIERDSSFRSLAHLDRIGVYRQQAPKP